MDQDFDRVMTSFSWSNPYAWPRKPLLAQNVVATQLLAVIVLTANIAVTSIQTCGTFEGGNWFAG